MDNEVLMRRVGRMMRKWWVVPMVAGMGVGVILLIVFLVNGYAPFGGKSLAVHDGEIQYLDLFAYFKDILAGKNDIFYTFSKMLGGNGMAIFSYYLASPLNLLVIFFSKTKLTTFFNVLVVIKIMLAAGCMAYFLGGRFRENLEKYPKRVIFVLLLSIAYALSEYPLVQSKNVMWLDAVYFLPLILLEVYRLIREGKAARLTILMAIMMWSNWYTGVIVGIFTIGWFGFEYLLNRQKFRVKDFLKNAVKLVGMMGLGVLMSGIIILPTIGALLSGNRSELHFEMLTDWSMIGDIFPGIVARYHPGATSYFGCVSLYCGMIAAVGIIGGFLSKKITTRKKKIFVGILVAVVLIFYWSPFMWLFSLFKNAGSYWYRYSFVGIFALIFIAAQFYVRREPLQLKMVQLAYIVALVLVDVGLNVQMIYGRNSTENVASHEEYATEAIVQVGKLNKYDTGSFRVSQTSNWGNVGNPYALTANYNEALAYGFWSISSYTSSPDDRQRFFLDRVGYRIHDENITNTNDSILGVDSLLGVKYIWSAYPINGLEAVSELGEHNGKTAYRNPFAIPMAFISKGEIGEDSGVSRIEEKGGKDEGDKDGFSEDSKTGDFGEEEGPFEYQNKLYSQLIGKEVEIYKPLKYTKKGGVYEVEIPKTLRGKAAIYANLEWEEFFSKPIEVNGVQRPYAQLDLGSSSVFYVSTDDEDEKATVVVAEEDIEKVESAQFYALDLEKLAEVSSELQRRPDEMEIRNGYTKFRVTAKDGENLVTTIPADRGWKIRMNGVKMSGETIAVTKEGGNEAGVRLFGETFYVFELKEGENEIEMIYWPPYLEWGIAVSVVATGLFVLGRRSLIKNYTIFK